MKSASCTGWVVLTLAALLLAGCSRSDMKGDDKRSDDSGAVKKGDGKRSDDDRPSKDQNGKPESSEPVARLTCKEFIEEFKKDNKAASDKYFNKFVELTGTLGFITFKQGDPGIALKKNADDNIAGDKVFCLTRDLEPWKKAAQGRTLKLRGKVSGMESTNLSECEIVEVTGPAHPAVTAEQLAKECDADSNATERKYKSKLLLITGEVDSITLKSDTGPHIFFKTPTPGTRVRAGFDEQLEQKMSTFMKGQKITILCLFDGKIDGTLNFIFSFPQ